jgi:hypothetical protein
MKRTCIKRMHLDGKSISKAAAVGAFYKRNYDIIWQKVVQTNRVGEQLRKVLARPFTRECVRWIASRRGGFSATRRESLDLKTMEKAIRAGCRPWSSGRRVGTPVTAGMVAKVRGGGKSFRQGAA